MKTSGSLFEPSVALFNNGSFPAKGDGPVPAGTPHLFGSITIARTAIWPKSSVWLLVPVLLMFWMGTRPLSASPLLSSNQLVFVNVDHAPMGEWRLDSAQNFGT